MTIASPANMTECTAAWFDAFAHPVRLRLLRLISANRATLSVEELVERMGSPSHAAILYHLIRMRRAGILTATQRGYRTYYALRPETLISMQEEVRRLLNGANS